MTDHARDDELNRAVVEQVLGFTRLPYPASPEYQKPGPDGVECLYSVPDFCHDLNACHAAEERIKEMGLTMWYGLCLMDIISPNTLFNTAHATARQRCEAMVAAVGRVGR